MADEFKACSVEGCNNNADRASHGRAGYCYHHYCKRRRGSPCTVEGCSKKAKGIGFCDKHYQRLKRHGSPLTITRTPNGRPKEFLEQVALLYEGDDCLIWPFSKSFDGYAKIVWEGKGSTVTRIICEIIYGHPGDGYHAAHSCGNGMKGCVNKRHLSWKTEAENQAEKFVHGTVLRGENNPPAKLTNAQVTEIVSLRGIESHSKLSKRFGVGKSTIGQIMTGARWGWLTGLEPSNGRRRQTGQ